MNKKKLLWKKWEKLNFTWELFIFHWKKCVVCNWKSRARRTFTHTHTLLCASILQIKSYKQFSHSIESHLSICQFISTCIFICFDFDVVSIYYFFIFYLSFEVNVCIFVIIIRKMIIVRWCIERCTMWVDYSNTLSNRSIQNYL